MPRALRALCLAAAVVLLFSSLARAERRVALVIGNEAYTGVQKLETAANDARAVGEQLRKVGFEVLAYSNLDRRGMNQAVGRFVEKVSGGGVGVVFYAGHGVQAGGSNYLLPVDIKAQSEQDLVDEAVDMQRILERLAEAKARLSLIIIDACRDNPFKKAHGRSIGASRGLAIPQAPSGTLVVYSAGIGQQALDRLSDADKNPNGLFTRELVPLIATPGLRLDDAVRRLRGSVIAKAKAVGHEQNPAIYDQTDGDFYFLSGPATVNVQQAGQVTVQAGGRTAPDPAAVELEYWQGAKQAGSAEAFEAYLKKYPQGQYADLARASINAVKAKKDQPQKPVPPAQPQRAQAGAQQVEIEFWSSVKDSQDRADFEAYLKRYPEGDFAQIAKNRLKALAEKRGGRSPEGQDGQGGNPFAVGQRVSVEWKGSWYDATVLEARRGLWKIHYDGYDASWDEYVGPGRIRPRR